ncbi:porin family protein [Neisseriaceae bacterium TC5R-5]|nr:porin family protein [Neisseriaceae bacterium TC5R-5]
MQVKMTLSAIVAAYGLFVAPLASAAQSPDAGLYGAVRVIQTFQHANDMDESLRPAGAVLPQDKRQNFINGSLALGYQLAAGWRAELEYTLPREQEYTSDVAGQFRGNLNHHKVDAQRLMVNGYYDLPVNDKVAVYASAGLGWASVKSSGWQGNPSRGYESHTDNNLAYSIGAGVSYSPVKKVSLDLGYRYVDMGKIESGYNNFNNARGLRDEKMKARLANHEVYFGARYHF